MLSPGADPPDALSERHDRKDGGAGRNAALAAYLVAGQPLPTVMPIIATAAWCVLFVLVGMWRFRREEF